MHSKNDRFIIVPLLVIREHTRNKMDMYAHFDESSMNA